MQLHVQLACAVRCSATGNSLCDAALTVLVDGERKKFIRRADGFIIFTDLKNGEHMLHLHRPYYRDAHLKVNVIEGESVIDVITMRPLYVTGQSLCRLKVTGLAPYSTIYISGQTYPIQLQQSECPAGTRDVRLFKRGAFTLIPPLKMLCADKDHPELCILIDRISEEEWRFAVPLKEAHTRGVKFYPTQPYEADENGNAEAIFFAAGPVSALYEGKLYELAVEEGETAWQIP